ncbi:MAG: zinc ribbon domain-containing protein [Bryobacteraceae bacterium]
MPLSKDAAGGGTESNGGKSTEYCSHCYASGKFTEPMMTAQEMIAKVSGKMKEMHITGFLARSFTKDIPKLKRWAGK